MSEKRTSQPYDPEPDPTEIQLRLLEGASPNDISISDLSNPQVVRILIHNHIVTLSSLRAVQSRVDALQLAKDGLIVERENLRVKISKLESQANNSWLEIPISFLSGFAINILTSDGSSTIGWFLLITSALMLTFIRGEQLHNLLSRNYSE